MHRARIAWTAGGATRADVAAGRYGRAHDWTFDGGATVRAAAAPSAVPAPWSDPAAVDPEEAFVAAVASCHMLWFLDLARRDGYAAARYVDDAAGEMRARPDGTRWIARVVLRPAVAWQGPAPGRDAQRRLHDAAHRHCFIANSARSEIVTEIP